MRESGKVGVGGIFLLGADKGDDAALGEEVDHLRAARELLEKIRVAPRGIHAKVRIDDVRVALEAHLVVAAARRTMDESDATSLLHRGEEFLDRDRTGDAGGVPVSAVVHGLALHRLKTDVGHLGGDIDDLRLDAGRRHALLDVVDVLLVRLPDVRRERLHLYACVQENAADGL